MAKISLSPPWVEYYREVNEMFKRDKEVRVVYDEDINKLSLYVDNEVKASALSQLLPVTKEFGTVVMEIEVVPCNTKGSSLRRTNNTIIEDAFAKNPAVNSIKTVSGIFDYDLYYVIFEKSVVQYFVDNLGDYNGIKSTLYENIARDIFEKMDGVFYCTDLSDTITLKDISCSCWDASTSSLGSLVAK